MRQAGVYTILNLVTGRVYIGSSVNVAHRWHEHLSHLRLGTHHNAVFQADWIRYGASSFSWTVVEECETRLDAIRAEQKHIDSTPDLYNAARRAGSGPRDGFRHTEESKHKMSAALKGKPKPEGFGEKVSAWKTGRPNPAQSAALKGRHHSPEHCEKIRISHLGQIPSAETRAKQSAALKGRDTSPWAWKMALTKTGVPWSEQRRAAYRSAALNGSNATRIAKMAATKTGVPWSAKRRAAYEATRGVLEADKTT